MTRYYETYIPDHPYARQNGCIYTHTFEAERKLGRLLKEHEVVHHIDENKTNNSHDNLMVMFDDSDHKRMHGPRAKYAVKRLDGSYTVPDSRYRSNKTWIKTWYGPNPTKIDWPEPKEVLRMVQETNYSAAGRELGVSDNAIRKFLKKNKLL